MNVDEITEKLNMYDELPYHCVFFNGVWGIGKSYAVDQVENTGRIVRVSLSGVKNSEEIYTAVLDAFVGKAGFTNVITKVAKTAVSIASNFESTKVAGNVISDVTDSFLSAKNKLSIYFRGQRKLRVVVLDDFERVWDGIDITEVFRTIDFFTSIKNVKVAIVGDLTKLPEEIKSKFDRYSERYIEKIYSVTDISKKIDWDAEPLGIDSDFILQFRTLHPFHNLRSAIKANNFYKDIRTLIIKRSTIVKPDSKRFWEDLRLTAFALVIESIDKIKLDEVYKRYSHDNLQNEFVSGMVKTLENRVSMYLNESKFGPALLMPLAKYYESDDLNISEFENIYRQSLENDTPAYFYSDSETIKRDLPAIKNIITQEEDPYKLLRIIRDYVKLCRLSGENDQDGVADFKKQLHKIVMNLIEQNSLEAIDTSHFPFVLENAELLKAANYEFTEGRKLMIQQWIDRMIKGDYTKSELEIADKLSLYGRMDIEYKKQIKARYSELLCENIFPINARNDIQYRTCVIMLKLLHGFDSEKLASYYQELMKSDLDSVAKNRCERAMERLDG